MNLTINHTANQLLVRAFALVLLLTVFLPSADADIDWGGGATRFFGADGEALTSQTGCATLVAVRAGELIDLQRFIPESPADLVRVGAELSEGESLNQIVAETSFFHSGYLLYSAIPDLTVHELTSLGLSGGEALYLVVWDRSTFSDGLPTDRSFYTVQPLYTEGEDSAPALVVLVTNTVFAQVTHPANELGEDQTLLASTRAGHNAFSGFLDWAQAKLDLDSEIDLEAARLIDSDQNGRNDFEEYVFNAAPSLQQGMTLASAGELEGDAVNDSTATTSGALQFLVELRANDTSLSYTAHASGDLASWLSSELYFEDGRWFSSESELAITAAIYSGEGVWTLAMQYEGAVENGQCFYKMSVSDGTL
ncbi:hypothetical protein ACWPKO_01250 [Coraliomargarita sp. W4R53]